jgi:pimeloyl-ACP methyl ester carboxylesterase
METFGTSWGNQAYERREGDSPTLVFLHGTGCDSVDWHAVLRHLPSGLDTLSIDFRGHGESSVPNEDFEFRDLSLDIHLALEILHIERPIIVGHSLGGMVGIELSTRRTLAGLILLEGWTSLSVAGNAFEKGQRTGNLSDHQIGEIDRKREATLKRFGGDQWRGFWHTVKEFDGSAALEAIDIPVYEIYGSSLASPDSQSQLNIPDRSNIHVEWVEGCGHFLPHEVPEKVAEICRQAYAECQNN